MEDLVMNMSDVRFFENREFQEMVAEADCALTLQGQEQIGKAVELLEQEGVLAEQLVALLINPDDAIVQISSPEVSVRLKIAKVAALMDLPLQGLVSLSLISKQVMFVVGRNEKKNREVPAIVIYHDRRHEVSVTSLIDWGFRDQFRTLTIVASIDSNVKSIILMYVIKQWDLLCYSDGEQILTDFKCAETVSFDPNNYDELKRVVAEYVRCGSTLEEKLEQLKGELSEKAFKIARERLENSIKKFGLWLYQLTGAVLDEAYFTYSDVVRKEAWRRRQEEKRKRPLATLGDLLATKNVKPVKKAGVAK
jgi:hypothetical protein